MNLPYKFELDGYCEGCPYFKVEMENIETARSGEGERKTLHTVRCSNRQACARVVRIINQGVMQHDE